MFIFSFKKKQTTYSISITTEDTEVTTEFHRENGIVLCEILSVPLRFKGITY